MNCERKRYSISPFACDDPRPLSSIAGAINDAQWGDFLPRTAMITHIHGDRREDGTWLMQMRLAVDPREWKIRIESGDICPYHKADFGKHIPDCVILAEDE